jgi:hypothetical protein
MSFFYRVGEAEARSLRLELDTTCDTVSEAEKLARKAAVLLERMAQNLPRGQAVHDVVQKMRADVKAET